MYDETDLKSKRGTKLNTFSMIVLFEKVVLRYSLLHGFLIRCCVLMMLKRKGTNCL